MRTIYRVRFKEPPLSGDERTEFFFTSLAAIYEVFTAEQIGCRVNCITSGFLTGNCTGGGVVR